jgi:hypothetical protein
MPDFFDRLEQELRSAATRAADPDPAGTVPAGDRRPRPRRMRRARPLMVAVLGLLVVGSAAAAVSQLHVTDASAPLHGTHVEPAPPGSTPPPAFAHFCSLNPGACPGSSPSRTRYSLSVLPVPPSSAASAIGGPGRVDAGEVGWCAVIDLQSQGSSGSVTGCTGARPASESARIAGGGFGTGRAATAFVVTDDRVAGIRLRDGRVVRPTADRALPSDWRAALWTRRGTTSARAATLLDRDGRPLPAAGRLLGSFRRVQPAAAASSSSASCRIASTSVAVRGGRSIVGEPRASAALAGRPFLICAMARVGAADQGLWAYVLLDARRPDGDVAALPGQRLRDGTATVGRALSARRVGRAWLVVASPAGDAAAATERTRALSALSVDLR